MVNELGPWSVRGMLMQAARIYRRHFWKFLLLSPALWGNLGEILLQVNQPGLEKSGPILVSSLSPTPRQWFALGMAILVYSVLGGAIIHMTASACAARQVKMRNSLIAIIRRSLAVIAATLMVGVVALPVLGLSMVAGVIIWMKLTGISGAMLSATVIAVGLVLGLKALTVWAFVMHAALIEIQNPIRALCASRELTRGHRWRVFGIAVVLASALASVPIFQNLPLIWAQMAISSFLAPYAMILTSVLYLDLRFRKGGLTPEQLAHETAVSNRAMGGKVMATDGLYLNR